MNLQILQHVPYEGMAEIGTWIEEKEFQFSTTKFFEKWELPTINKIDMLIIMGGPMGIYDEKKFPWLIDEKKYIEKAIKKDKIIIGICLGSQLIANVLGAKVYKNKYKEIGWYEILMTEQIKKLGYFEDVDRTTVFHWHGDTFDLPKDSIGIASSKVTENQGFIFNKKVIGLQFHIESNMASVKKLVSNSKKELSLGGDYVQTEKEILKNTEKYSKKMNKILFKMLDKVISY